MSPKVIINFVLFQLGWFTCVLGAAKNMPWLGVVVVLAIVTWHLWQAKSAKSEIILLLIALLIGGIFDQLMLSNHLISYRAHSWGDALLPAWILALWAVFITTFNVSLRWMRNRWLIAALFGAAGGPLAYFAAENLGAVTFNIPLAYVALGLGWAILTPLLLKISTKFDGYI
jgi:Protein of unknown function (DUF2878)